MAARDVRMRGFQSRSTVEDATAWLDRAVMSISADVRSERLPLSSVVGRILAEGVTASISVPAFDRSAMDGYALLGEETFGATSFNPLPFRVLGTSFPGTPFEGQVGSGTCVRIMTGAPMPEGADAVLPVELTETDGSADQTEMQAIDVVPPGKNVGRIGEDVREGTEILAAGKSLRPQDAGLCAAVGISEVAVRSAVRVRLLVTGDELVEVGDALAPFQIYDSNSVMLTGLVQRDGGEFESIRRLTDDRESIRDALTDPGADVILVSGGSSVGSEDHAPTLVAEEGELGIHGIAMRPSSPTGIGKVGKSVVVLLPGNPVSCLCAYDFFAGRAIRTLAGQPKAWPYATEQLPLRNKIASAIGRVDYARVAIRDGHADPIAVSGASILSSTVRADGFVIIPAANEGYAAGSEVAVYRY